MRSLRILKQTLLFFTAAIFMTGAAQADESKIPEPFRGYNQASSLSISYDDVDQLLRATVMNVGMSKRKKAKKSEAQIGSRIKMNVKRMTADEGNRFFFETFDSDEKKAVVTDIRKSLESLPDEAPLNNFSKPEQLAYWLNLYNITMLEQLINIYPEKDLEDFIDSRKSLLKKKLLKVAGVELSLNDIQHNILMPKFENDLRILYGLYQGYIGGPSIRRQAYTSDNVFKNLEDNTYEFVNSNRGTYFGRKDIFRISTYYERNEQYFPNFKKDVSDHVHKYLIGSMRYQLERADKVRSNISNWQITDLYGSVRKLSSSAATNEAALMDAGAGSDSGRPDFLRGSGVFAQGAFTDTMQSLVQSFGRFSPEETAKLQALNEKRLIDSGSVKVTDIEPEESEEQK